MKQLILFIGFLCLGVNQAEAKSQDKDLSAAVTTLQSKLNTLQNEQAQTNARVKTLQGRDTVNKNNIDSLANITKQLSKAQTADHTSFSGKIVQANKDLNANKTQLSHQASWGIGLGAIIIIGLVVAVILLLRKIKWGNSSIEDVRKAQSSLQEESIKLDNKLLEIAEKQMATTPTSPNNSTIDHSLTLKVADEITRIETNLSRMDESVRGHKQLSKAVQRIKDNFQANGYEIVDMLGKPYVEGMKAAVTFVTDESLSAGQKIITKIIKPQINYQQQIIQAAQIEVSQSE